MTTPEETFNQQVWEILKEIKEKGLATLKNKPIKYFRPNLVAGVGVIPQERKDEIFYKLQEWGAIRIREDPFEPPESTETNFYFHLIQPKFDKIYKKFQKACDLNSYLNDLQEKLYKGKKKPEFLQVKLDKQKSQMAIRPGIFLGYTKPTAKTSNAREIADGFSEQNRHFVKQVLEEIVSLSEFSSDGKVHYQIQSQPGQEIIKERSLLNKFESYGLFRNLGEDGIWGIAILNDLDIDLIKEVIKRIEELDSGVVSEDEFVEIKNQNKGDSQAENALSENKNKPNKPDKINKALWQEDFKWSGKRFVFGQYGSTGSFNSKARKDMFHELANAKGGWVTVRELRELTGKGDDYLRPTIGQIERVLNKELRKYISIPSTEDDDLEPKPQEGAYRIKFTPNPL